jgi:predicted TIM-barrel fold metal-dependent hydrolase
VVNRGRKKRLPSWRSTHKFIWTWSTISWIGGPAGRPAFHAFLKQAIVRGLEKRIMFGSDQMGRPDAIGLAIAGVDSAPFLISDQKHDIFYGNAATCFLLRDQD